MYRFEERLGGILLLGCAAVLAGLVYWYPWYLCTYHSADDDRYGFAMLYAFPFWFIGPAIAARALHKLLRAVARGRHTTINAALAVCGVLLALVGFSPVLILIGTAMFR